jgi:type II secretory pathway pseudopilin PulG
LITLGIIGVVAALTMPALVASHQEKVTVTKIKKLYSALQQGYTMAEQEYGDPTNWGLIGNGNTQGAQNMAEKFKPYLKVASEKSDSEVYTLNLADGSALKFYPRSATCTSNRGTGRFANSCAVIEVHFTHANTVMGKTSFQFIAVKDGVIPSGLPDDAPARSSVTVK